MKKFITIIISLFMIQWTINAQTEQNVNECKKDPQADEIVIGVIEEKIPIGGEADEYDYDYRNKKYVFKTHIKEDYGNGTDEKLIKELSEIAKSKYEKHYTHYYFRNYTRQSKKECEHNTEFLKNIRINYAVVSVTVVIKDPQIEATKKLTYTINKALQSIKEGSRLAIDQIKIANGNKDDFKDQIVEILLDEGYKVVAKDYLEKLLEEQEQQQSGVYNSKTTVKENNLSAVGYYINIKQTETAIKVQVINVSTGEYEANVTENL